MRIVNFLELREYYIMVVKWKNLSLGFRKFGLFGRVFYLFIIVFWIKENFGLGEVGSLDVEFWEEA